MSPVWITFYSVRGGVGRSTLLALCALELARVGRRVVVVDFDLEAPGLDILLTPIGAPEKDQVRAGVVDYLAGTSKGERVSLDDIALPRELPGDYKGRLFMIPAGRCDEPYLANLDTLDFPRFYDRPGLLNPVRSLRADIDEQLSPDVVLVDSRTGYSDTALFTLFDLADAVVTVLIPDSQNVERLGPIVRRVIGSPRQPNPRLFLVASKCHGSPAAMRAIADAEDKLRALIPVEEEDLPDEEERPPTGSVRQLHRRPAHQRAPMVDESRRPSAAAPRSQATPPEILGRLDARGENWKTGLRQQDKTLLRHSFASRCGGPGRSPGSGRRSPSLIERPTRRSPCRPARHEDFAGAREPARWRRCTTLPVS